MGSLVKKEAEKFLRENQRRRRWLVMFLCLALVVTSGTFAALRMDGRAMDDGQETVCGQEAHQHTAECYSAEDGSLSCGMEEHQHTEVCYTGGQDVVRTEDGGIPEGGEAAQTETAADGLGPGNTDPQGDGQEPGGPNTEAVTTEDREESQKRLEDVELTGDWRTDVIETAKSQIGHTYEEYAAWDGEEGARREDWSSLFVSYCLAQAGVDGIPLQADSRAWMEELARKEWGLYRDAAYSPMPGDIVFYGSAAEDEGKEASEDALHAGLVEEWNEQTGELWIIAGGVDQVRETACSVYGEHAEIQVEGYGRLPEADAQEPGTEGENAGAEIGKDIGADIPEGLGTDGDGNEVSGPANGGGPQEGNIIGNVQDGSYVSENTISGDAVSGNTVSDNTVSDNIVSDNTASGNTVPSSPVRRRAAAGRSAENPFSWGVAKEEGVDVRDDGGVRTWDVSGTSHRYLEIPVRMNLSATAGTEIVFPYVLEGAGRTVVTSDGQNYTYTPECQVGGIEEGQWDKVINEAANTVTITSDGQHAVLDVYYKFDCWNIVSDKEFTIEVRVVKEGTTEQYPLKGKIHTEHDVKIGNYLNGVGNSDYAFDGFGGADKKTAYIPKWNPVYKKYFGLEKGEFDSEKYVYDIAAFLICPEYQQPYHISGNFDPQGGQIIGGVYMMDSRGNPDGLCIKLAPGEKEPGETYDFTISNDRLIFNDRYAVVSDLKEQHKVYTLYFLVKYPKVEDDNAARKLGATLTLHHKGVDSGDDKSVSANTILYEGPQTYRDRIYWAAYNPETGENQTGLSSLSSNRTATVDFSADFYCLNENRTDFQDGTNEEELKKYSLEAVIDLSFLVNGQESKMLEEGDYRFSAYKLCLIDAAGAWSHNTDGVPNVGWEADKYTEQGSAPDWADNEKIKIYGSRSLTDQNEDAWEYVGEITASEVWASDQDRAFKSDYTSIAAEDYVRLKVVYDSRLTTALRVGYQMEVKPSALSKIPNSNDLETLQLRSWFNYLAYNGNDADGAAKDFGRYPVSDVGDGNTIEMARQHDDIHPYPQFVNPRVAYNDKGEAYWPETFSLRNRATITLRRSTDAAGMLVTQALYDSSGKVIGDKERGTWEQPHALDPEDSYCMQKDVTNVSEIVYSITGVVTNGANDAGEFDAYRQKCSEASPYRATKQRYYVLLPEGLTLNMVPDGEHNQREGTETYLSPIAPFYNEHSDKQVSNAQEDQPVSKGRLPNWEPTRENGRFLTQMMWEFDVSADYGSVQKNPESGGQLFIFDRMLAGSGVNKSDVWRNGSGTYCWGQGFSFSVVPEKGTGTLAADMYEPKFWCQFLDGNDRPISMTEFLREEEKNADELNKAYGSNSDIDESTLLYIPISFTNHSASGSSQAKISLSGNDVEYEDERYQVDLEGKYEYELKYSITNGKSQHAVLWCNIEEYDRGGESSEWKGVMEGVDLNGNEEAAVYVQTKNEFNVDQYLAGAKREWLTDGTHGWTKVENLENYDWKNVRSIAFDFGEREFVAERDRGSASVFIKMKAPAGDQITKKPYQTRYTAYNEFVFSDEQAAEQEWKPGRGLSEPTQLDVYVPADTYELPSTGGAGTYAYTIGGILLMGAALVLLYRDQAFRRKRKGRAAAVSIGIRSAACRACSRRR